MIHLVLFTLPADSRSNLRCSKTSGFVHQHLASSVGNDMKSYIGSLSIFHLHHPKLQGQVHVQLRLKDYPSSARQPALLRRQRDQDFCCQLQHHVRIHHFQTPTVSLYKIQKAKKGQREIDVETEEGKLGFESCTREKQVTSLVKSQVHPPIINISTPPPPNNGADGAVGTLVILSFSNTLMAPSSKLIVLQPRLVLATKQPSVVTIGTDNYLSSSIVEPLNTPQPSRIYHPPPYDLVFVSML
ncbi:hypothetical protein DVH24_022941 [Malus domestica]|uniref:Uncharacterized protein n=1 Tax=Malus domestica TaxID=3750 RepID=A0A498KMP9_MALDO|nr:hypothetical protein DVH24_022941 [Malus domestica]